MEYLNQKYKSDYGRGVFAPATSPPPPPAPVDNPTVTAAQINVAGTQVTITWNVPVTLLETLFVHTARTNLATIGYISGQDTATTVHNLSEQIYGTDDPVTLFVNGESVKNSEDEFNEEIEFVCENLSEALPSGLNKTSSGLLYRSPDTSDSLATDGWTVGTGWSKVLAPGYIAFPTARVLVDRLDDSDDAGGLREPHLIISESGAWTLYYDAGDGTTVWQIHTATSDDKGVSWVRQGELTLNHGSSAYAGYQTFCLGGWITRDPNNNTYYLQVLTTDSVQFDNVPWFPYEGSIYSTDDLAGNVWDWVADSPVRGSGADFDEGTATVSHVFFNGIEWEAFYSAKSASNVYNAGRLTGADLTGWTKDGTGAIIEAPFLFDSGAIENPKVWFSNQLQTWVMFGNNNLKESTDTWFSTSSEFNANITHQIRVQHKNSDIDTRNTISVSAPFADADGNVLQETNGEVPFVYAGDYDPANPLSNFEWHRIRVGYLEPFNYVIKFEGGSAVYLKRDLPAQDFVAEYTVEPHSTGGNVSFVYRFNNATSDAGGTGYLVDSSISQNRVSLYRLTTGSFSQMGGNAQPDLLTQGNAGCTNAVRIKVVVAGNNHKVYVNGELYINENDATHSGTYMGFRGVTGPVNVRGFRIRSSDVVTFHNAEEEADFVVRGFGDYPIEDFTGIGMGTQTFEVPHGRAESIEYNGTVYTIPGGISGGDVYTYVA